MKFIPYFFTLLIYFVFVIFFHFDIYSSIGLSIFGYWTSRLLIFSSRYLPIKELFFSLYSLQYLFSPAFMYNGLGDYTRYKMKIPSEQYFSFAIPALIFFSLGFTVLFDSNELRINKIKIDRWLKNNSQMPYYLIILGFAAPFFTVIFPSYLNFVIYLAESLKYIGLFILLSSSMKMKVSLMIAIFFGLILNAFASGMFHDLLIWLIMLGTILDYRYKPNVITKLTCVLSFVLFAMFIQFIKENLRSKLWGDNATVSLDLLQSAAEESADNNESGFFDLNALGPSVNRINQGWVLASTMENVPDNISHSHGLLVEQYLSAAVIPRFLWKNKINGGDTKFFNLYSGHLAGVGTVMVLGTLTEAYVEFEGYGAFLYIFLYGVLYGWVLRLFARKSQDFPLLAIFTILVFMYPIRPDCDSQTALGHLIKTSFLLAVIFSWYKHIFIVSNK